MMKKIPTVFLQVLIALIGIGALSFLIREPQTEGVNAHATLFQMYFSLFVAYVYIASIPFFVALYQAIKMLGYARQDKEFSQESLKAVRTMKLCGLVMIGFAVVSVIFMIGGDPDDRPGGVFMRLLITLLSATIASVGAMFERIFQKVERHGI